MGNVARILLRDVKRLAKTPAAWSVAFFLIVLPSLYTWFNVAGFWNPYDNTGNLRVCVVNEDAGASDETLGELDLGSQVVGQLEENNQLAWAFVDYDEAMQEVESGSAYAAFVIPSDFSANVATIISADFQQPKLQYYVNEKTGPVAPKITDTGANSLDTTINDAFFSTVSSTVVALLNERIDEAEHDLAASKDNAAGRIDKASASIAEAREALSQLGGTSNEARAKADAAKATLADAKTHLDMLSSDLASASSDIGETNTALVKLSGDTNSALDEASAELSRVSRDTTLAIAQTSEAIAKAREAARAYSIPGSDWAALQKALDDAADAAAGTTEPVEELVDNALTRSDSYRKTIATSTVPALSDSLAQFSTTSSTLSTTASNQKLLIDQASRVLDQLDSTLALSSEALRQTDRSLAEVQRTLNAIRTDLSAIGASEAIQRIMGDDGIDQDKVADFMMSPTQIENEVLYPLNAYGSAMAPLFINLTLWIGVFMLMVIMRLEVDDEDIEGLTITQRFIARGAFLSVMAAAQAAVCCTGCLLLGVQSANVAMFYLTAIVASLSYLAIQYTLSTTLQHVGKGLCIILVFVQIPGATGLYPIEMTPDFFHIIYPLFPFTYGINAIRETISGFYGNLWLQNVGMLFLFFTIFVAIGILVRPYLTNLNRLFAREISESDIINGESVELPARRYRMSQVIRVFADREEYRSALNARITRLIALYPKLMMGALGTGIAIPFLATAVLAALGIEKVVILTTWLIWFLLVVFFLIVVEYLRDYLSHLASLDAMSADEVRDLYAKREQFTKVKPIAQNFGRAEEETRPNARESGSSDEEAPDA